MRKMIFTFMLTIVSSVWMTSKAGWCMSVAKAGSAQNIRIGGTFQAESMPCEDDTLECPPCLTIALKSGGIHYLVSNDPQIVAILDTVTIGSFAIIEGNHYLEGHVDFINVTNIIFPETDIQQLSGEWEISRETVSTPTGDGGTRWFSTHDVNYTNYVLADDLIYKVILDQSSGYAHYSDAVPYTVDRKEDGTWLLTAEGLFSSSNPVEEGIPSPATIYRLTEDEMEWMYAANGGDEGPDYYYQHLKRHTQKEDKLPSLCDEWNVLEISNVTCGYCEEYRTYNFHLTTDTVIGGLLYSQLIKDGAYKGALREGNNRDIYCVPAGCSQEYLLYAFNAQVGDSLKNIWVGGYSSRIPDVRSAIVSEIKQTTPRTIELEVHYYEAPDAYEESIRNLTWIEGIGMPFGPMGAECSVFNGCADSKAKLLLCAYKNGEQVYVSEEGKKYGCEYNGEGEQARLPSLCDEWNILGIATPDGYDHFHTFTQRLTTDTIIGDIHYDAKLEQSGTYLGAMREGYNRDIYYIPNGTTHEYLLYAFNAQAGDTLNNMWVGGHFSEEHNGKRAVVREIRDTSPRTFVVEYEYTYNADKDTIWWPYYWIEGVGMSCGPSGVWCPFDCEGDYGELVLCAYKKGEQIYISEFGEQYGCEYNYDPFAPVDTIPLFARDDSGSSTVDPVDPNQVVASLRGNELIIQEFMGVEISYTLRHKEPAKTPSSHRAPQSDTFRDEVTIPITEAGEYLLELTNPSWGYTIFGEFDYLPQGIETVHSYSTQHKVLLNGRLYIHHGDHIYDTQGKMIK